MIKFHQKHFIASILLEQFNPDKTRTNRPHYEKIDGSENKLTNFQIYPGTEDACKYTTPFIEENLQKLLSNTKNVSTWKQENQ